MKIADQYRVKCVVYPCTHFIAWCYYKWWVLPDLPQVSLHVCYSLQVILLDWVVRVLLDVCCSFSLGLYHCWAGYSCFQYLFLGRVEVNIYQCIWLPVYMTFCCVVESANLYCSVIFDSSVVFRGPPCNRSPYKILTLTHSSYCRWAHIHSCNHSDELHAGATTSDSKVSTYRS